MKRIAMMLERSAVVLAVIALAGILALVAGQVGARVFAGRPLPWPEELGRVLFIYLVFIGAAEASVTRTHIAVDLVDTFGLSRRADRVLDLIRDAATLLVLAIIAWGAWQMIPVVHSMKLPATGVRMSWMVTPVLVGAAMMLLATVLNIVAHLRGERSALESRIAEPLDLVD
jgi:TRAP-type transport system small permease protein